MMFCCAAKMGNAVFEKRGVAASGCMDEGRWAGGEMIVRAGAFGYGAGFVKGVAKLRAVQRVASGTLWRFVRDLGLVRGVGPIVLHGTSPSACSGQGRGASGSAFSPYKNPTYSLGIGCFFGYNTSHIFTQKRLPHTCLKIVVRNFPSRLRRLFW